MSPDQKRSGVEMAFVRWRGNSASLLTTVYDQGKSRQVLLARLGSGYTVPRSVQRLVAERFPNIAVDWTEVNAAMAQGPAESPPLTSQAMDFLAVETKLREWAQIPSPFRRETAIVVEAADVLVQWRARTDTI